MKKKLAILAIYLILLFLAVPIYWSRGPDSLGNKPMVFGLPTWFCVSVICSIAVSGITAYLIIFHWRESDSSDETGGRQ